MVHIIRKNTPVPLAHWLEKALVQNGFAVDCVNDGRAADHLLQGENYAVAILDIGMPGFDGLEVVHRLRSYCFNNHATEPLQGGSHNQKKDTRTRTPGSPA